MQKKPWKLISDVPRVVKFFNTISPLALSTDMTAIGMEWGGELRAAAVYQGYNGHNVWMHIAAQPGGRWLTRDALRYAFVYPFSELGVDRISGYVNASNQAARRFDEHLGFRPEATLQGAAADGGDVIVYVMRWQDCRFLRDKPC
jgi:L-amino acid N-acyltransferase YncA